MPDHFHLISNPRDGRIKEFVGESKSLSAKAIIDTNPLFKFPDHGDQGHQVWQESFKAMPLWSGCMIWQKINYIHSNPVKAGLVKSAKDYRWSSFGSFYAGRMDPLRLIVNGHGQMMLKNFLKRSEKLEKEKANFRIFWRHSKGAGVNPLPDLEILYLSDHVVGNLTTRSSPFTASVRHFTANTLRLSTVSA